MIDNSRYILIYVIKKFLVNILLVRWSDRLSTGIRVFDEQHKKLVAILNDMHEALKSGKGREALADILRRLENYARTHFTSEEVIMRKYEFPGYLEHKREHEQFIAKVKEFRRRYEAGDLTLSFDVLKFLKDWLINHIMGTDKKYGPYLRSKGFA